MAFEPPWHEWPGALLFFSFLLVAFHCCLFATLSRSLGSEPELSAVVFLACFAVLLPGTCQHRVAHGEHLEGIFLPVYTANHRLLLSSRVWPGMDGGFLCVSVILLRCASRPCSGLLEGMFSYSRRLRESPSSLFLMLQSSILSLFLYFCGHGIELASSYLTAFLMSL